MVSRRFGVSEFSQRPDRVGKGTPEAWPGRGHGAHFAGGL